MTDATAQAADPTVNGGIYGKTIPLVFGRTKTLCAPIWTGPITLDAQNNQTFSFAFCIGKRAPLVTSVDLLSIWFDSRLVWDRDQNIANIDVEFFDGDEGQGPSSTITNVVGDAPAFRDRIYVVVRNYTVPVGSAFPIVKAAVEQFGSFANKRYYTYYQEGDPGANEWYYSKYLSTYTIINSVVTYPGGVQTVTHTASTYDINSKTLLYAVTLDCSPGVATQRFTGCLSKDQLVYYCHCQNDAGQFLMAFDLRTGNKLAQIAVPNQFFAMGCRGRRKRTGPGIRSGNMASCEFIGIADFLGVAYFFAFTGNSFIRQQYALNFASAVAGQLEFADNVTPGSPLWITDDVGEFYEALVGYISTPHDIFQFFIPANYRSGPNAWQGCHLEYNVAADGCFHLFVGYHGDAKMQVARNYPPTFAFFNNIYRFADDMPDVIAGGGVYDHACMIVAPSGGDVTVLPYYVRGSGDTAGGTGQRFVRVAGYFSPNNRVNVSQTINHWDYNWYVPTVPYKKLVSCDVPGLGINPLTVRSVPPGQTKVISAQGSGAFSIFDFVSGSRQNFTSGVYFDVRRNQPGGGLVDGTHVYDSDTKLLYYPKNYYDNPGEVSLRQSTTGNLLVSDLLTQYGLLAGFTADQIVCTGFDDAVVGSIINVEVPFVDLVQQVVAMFCIDCFESAGVLHFNRLPTGTSFVTNVTLTAADLAVLAQDDSDDGTVVRKSRQNALALPTSLEVDYIDPDNEFQIGAQIAKRTVYPYRTVAGLEPTVISVPIALHGQSALYYASLALFAAWNASLQLELLLPFDMCVLEPGDVMYLNAGDVGVFKAKVTDVALNADWSVSVLATTLSLEKSATPITDTVTVAPAVPKLPTLKSVVIDNLSIGGYSGKTLPEFQIITNVPALVTVNGMTGQTAGGALFGTIPFDHPAPGNFDQTTTLTVTLVDGEPPAPDTATYQAGGAVALIGSSNRWELIRWQSATKLATGLYRLDGVVRGRNGTDVYMAFQRPGDWIVFFPPAAVLRLQHQVYTDVPLTHATVNSGSDVDVDDIFVVNGSLLPYAPVKLTAHASGSDAVLSWTRRDRAEVDLNNDGDDNVSMPMSEATEAYDLEIVVAGGVVRTVAGLTTPSYTYTAANMTADGVTSPVTFNVYQLSAVVGRGFKGSATCPIT